MAQELLSNREISEQLAQETDLCSDKLSLEVSKLATGGLDQDLVPRQSTDILDLLTETEPRHDQHSQQQEPAQDSRLRDLVALNTFLYPDKSDGTSRERLNTEPILYDITLTKDDERLTIGRAVKITENFLLTAYHVVEGEELRFLSLTPQTRRGYVRNDSTTFQIVAQDPKNDLALLRTVSGYNKENKGGKALCYLSADIPSEGQEVIQFLRLSPGKPSSEDYVHTVHAKNLYSEKPREGLCSILLPAGSLLLEERGKIIPYKYDEIKKIFPYTEYDVQKIKNTRLCTIFSYNGESGSPIFTEGNDGKLTICGILTRGMGLADYVEVPDHPLGPREMQLVTTVFQHREPIRAMIRKFLDEGRK